MIELQARLGERLLRDEPLAKFTAARLGGPADWLYIARRATAELVDVLTTCWGHDLPVYVLGGGANVLISDDGVRGLVVINRVSAIDFLPEGQVRVSAGTGLTVLARKCASRGLAGLEWAASVPGTVGGAVVGNAGAHGGDMAGTVRSITLVDSQDGQRTIDVAQMAYGYRTSMLKARADRRFLVLDALMQLMPDDPAQIEARMDGFIEQRKRTQPPGASLGSIFKNPPGDYAGRLIEAAGLKGCAIGGAQVSPVHANFFINRGGAAARDYYALIAHVRETVAAQFGVWLEPEIEILGENLKKF